MEEWHRQRSETFRSPRSLPPDFELYPSEARFFTSLKEGPKTGLLDFAVPPYYLSLAGAAENDPIRRQCIPRVEELLKLPYEDDDPISDLRFSPVERLVHRYKDRALLLVTDECAMYCRHCFRRHFSSWKSGMISNRQLSDALDYIAGKPEIHELILSGGDPLTLEDTRLEYLLDQIHSRLQRPVIIRIATRIPVVLPQRITPALLELLGRFPSIYIITQFNHSREITAESSRAVGDCVRAGIPVLNQAVLLKGVNDSLRSLKELFQSLLEIKVKPYYLFQGDLASGTSHFRVPLREGMELYRLLRQEVSGLAMPVYAIDLPGGGGKVPVMDAYLEELENDESGRPLRYRFTGPDGNRYYYPAE